MTEKRARNRGFRGVCPHRLLVFVNSKCRKRRVHRLKAVCHDKVDASFEKVLELPGIVALEMYHLYAAGMGVVGVLPRPRTRQLEVMASVRNGVRDELRVLLRRPVAVARTWALDVVGCHLRCGLPRKIDVLEFGGDERLMEPPALLQFLDDGPMFLEPA